MYACVCESEFERVFTLYVCVCQCQCIFMCLRVLCDVCMHVVASMAHRGL